MFSCFPNFTAFPWLSPERSVCPFYFRHSCWTWMCFPINGLRNFVLNIISWLPLCFALNVVYSDRQQLEECLGMESAVLLSPKHRSSIKVVLFHCAGEKLLMSWLPDLVWRALTRAQLFCGALAGKFPIQNSGQRHLEHASIGPAWVWNTSDE